MTAQHKQRAALKDAIGTMIAQGYAVATCPVSGITAQIKIEGLAKLNQVYSMHMPWATVPEARKLIKHNSLSNLTSEMLAGVVLTLAGPTGLGMLELQTMSAVEANAVLRTIAHPKLCALVRTLEQMDRVGANTAPKLALPEASSSIEFSVEEWRKTIASYLPRSAHAQIAAIAEQEGIHILSKEERNKLALARVVSVKPALAKYEVEFSKSATLAEAQEEFKVRRAEARAIWKDILEQNAAELKPGLVSTMKILLAAQALTSCNPELRAKIVTAVTKIQHKQAQALARIIKETHNPYNPLNRDDAETILDSVSFSSEQPTDKRLSLAQLIAAKKAARASTGNDATNDAPSDF